MDCPHVAARQTLIEVPDPVLGTARLVGPPIKLSGDPTPITGPAPRLGEHTVTVLKELLGYTEDQVAQLSAEGAI